MPPEARDHETRATLDGGTDGLAVMRRVAAGALGWLATGGTVLLESSERQAAAMCEVLADAGLAPRVVVSEDLGATVVTGRREH